MSRNDFRYDAFIDIDIFGKSTTESIMICFINTDYFTGLNVIN